MTLLHCALSSLCSRELRARGIMSAVSISSSSSFSTAGPVGADAGPLAFAYPNADQQRTRTGSFASTNNLQTQPALTLNAFFTDIASYKSSMTAASSATEYVSIVSAEYIVTAADASDIRGHPAAAASTMTATCKSQSPQGAFPGYGPGPFGGRDSVASEYFSCTYHISQGVDVLFCRIRQGRD